MKTMNLPVIFVAGLFCLAVVGCNSKSDKPDASSGSNKKTATAESDEHSHPSEGPHHGDLVELGNEEYHAELLHPEDKKDPQQITVYILDSSAKKAVPVEATEITINLQHEGKGGQFKLKASPDTGDPSGKSSRFISTDKELLSHFGEEELEGQLVVTIAGKSYRGKIKHDHDHDHDHKH